jgi:hypothetical protein
MNALLPAAVGAILPGFGGALGQTITGTLGLGELLGETGSSVIGNALLGGGLGYLTGGSKGIGPGAIGGGASPLLLSGLSGLTGTDFSGGLLSSLTGGGASKALNFSGGLEGANAARPNGAPGSAASGTGGQGQQSNLFSNLFGGGSGAGGALGKIAPLAIVGAALAGSMGGNKNKGDPPPSVNNPNADPSMTARLSQVPFDRKQNPYDFNAFRYGYGPQRQFFQNNQLPSTGVTTAANGGPIGYARGGAGLGAAASRYVEGPGTGRSDDIPALLSDGEYVIDAETVALLGDGSTRAGAQRLDSLRSNVRKHKGQALSKGKISSNARAPEQYIGAM